MRFLFRIALLGLAAFGAKTLYERYRPALEGATTKPGGGAAVLEPTRNAVREVVDHAKSAAGEVAEHAKSAASDAASRTKDQLSESTGDSSNTSPTSS
jgi:hypothetical protein